VTTLNVRGTYQLFPLVRESDYRDRHGDQDIQGEPEIAHHTHEDLRGGAITKAERSLLGKDVHNVVRRLHEPGFASPVS
jgi:hypothetical protein